MRDILLEALNNLLTFEGFATAGAFGAFGFLIALMVAIAFAAFFHFYPISLIALLTFFVMVFLGAILYVLFERYAL